VFNFDQSLFFLTDPSPPDIYTLSLHDALPISLWDLGLCSLFCQPKLAEPRLDGKLLLRCEKIFLLVRCLLEPFTVLLTIPSPICFQEISYLYSYTYLPLLSLVE